MLGRIWLPQARLATQSTPSSLLSQSPNSYFLIWSLNKACKVSNDWFSLWLLWKMTCLEGLEVKGCWEIVVKRLRVAEEFFISSYLSPKSPIWTLLFSLLSFNFSLPNLEFASVREMLQLSFLMTSVELCITWGVWKAMFSEFIYNC